MTFNIASFSAELNKGGIQHNSDYDVYITLPPVLIGKYSQRKGFVDVSYMDQLKMLSMRCENASIPGVALRSTISNRHGSGIFEKMPYSAGFTDLNLSFICDVNGNIPNFWYSWMNLITNFADSNELFGGEFKQYVCNYKDDFVSDISINKYNKAGEKIQTAVLQRAFPLSISESPLSWQDQNITKTTVGISFKNWFYEGNQIRLNEE